MAIPRSSRSRSVPLAGLLLPLLASVGALLGGCAGGSGSADVPVAAGGYETAFQTARDVLRDEGFALERVDAELGVITTRPSGAPRGPEEVAHRQRRIVRVAFAPETGEAPEAVVDRAAAGTLRFRALVERVQRPGWRPSAVSVRLSTVAGDPELGERGMQPTHAVPLAEDQALGAALAATVRRRLAAPSPPGGG